MPLGSVTTAWEVSSEELVDSYDFGNKHLYRKRREIAVDRMLSRPKALRRVAYLDTKEALDTILAGRESHEIFEVMTKIVNLRGYGQRTSFNQPVNSNHAVRLRALLTAWNALFAEQQHMRYECGFHITKVEPHSAMTWNSGTISKQLKNTAGFFLPCCVSPTDGCAVPKVGR